MVKRSAEVAFQGPAGMSVDDCPARFKLIVMLKRQK